MNLQQLFDLTIHTRGREPALEFYDHEDRLHTITFEQVDQRARRMAAVLESRGLKRGDRVCLHLSNCVEIIDLYLACIRLGIIFVPINILYKEREMTHILNDAQPALLVDDQLIDHLAKEAESARPITSREPLDGDDPAAIIYTSGTTGASKGAILTHNNFASNGINLNACWQITSADRFLLALPLFHVHGLGNGLHCWLLSGCRMRLLERFDQRKAAETFLDFRPTLFFGVPTIYVRLLNLPEQTAREIGGFMRLFVSGSAPLPAQVLEEFHSLVRPHDTGTIRHDGNPDEHQQSVPGRASPWICRFPLPGVSIQIRDGELYIKGPNVFAGYWRREEATRAAFVDGYFRTGDIAERSDDGYYTLKGRRSDVIISGGFNIYPREIEEFLLEQEEVTEAAVSGCRMTSEARCP